MKNDSVQKDKWTIIVIEDDKNLNNLIQKKLRSLDYKVIGILTGTETLEFVKNDDHVLLLIDYRLSDMLCDELISEMHAKEVELPFIVMTGNGDENIAVKMMKAGAYDYVVKNLNFIEIIPELIERVIHLIDTEKSLKESEKLFRIIASNLPNSYMAIINKDLIVEFTSGQEYKIRELDPKKFIGLKPEEIYGEQTEIVKDYYNKTFLGEEKEFELEIKNRNYLFNTVPLKEDTGEIKRIIVLVENITEFTKLKDQLHHADKMNAIGQLAGGVAHDFNNQLAGIMSCSELLKYTYKSDKFLQKYLNIISNAVKRSSDLTSKLLAFAHKGKNQLIPVNINMIISEVISMLEHSINKKIKIKKHLAEEKLITIGDPTQLQNAILNIGINANDAMQNGGVINFKTEIADAAKESILNSENEALENTKFIKIIISDSGIGMGKEIQKRVFEPFFTTKKKGKGLGMGLSAVYGTVHNHHGKIAIESELNIGTSIIVYLPISMEKEKVNENPVELIKGFANILLVDDEEAIREVTEQILKELGYSVVICDNGFNAIKHYKKEWKNIDIVIMDIAMPEMSGSEAFKVMKVINPDIKALISTGFSVDGEVQNMLNSGAKDFMQKPFKLSELSSKLSSILKVQ